MTISALPELVDSDTGLVVETGKYGATGRGDKTGL